MLPNFYRAVFRTFYGSYAMLLEVSFEVCLERELRNLRGAALPSSRKAGHRAGRCKRLAINRPAL